MGAYKQFLTSDVITTPLKVHKDFTFQGSSSLFSSSICRFLGYNLYQFDFEPGKDPHTGNYTIVTAGHTSSAQFNYLNIHSEVSTLGSSSFLVNTIDGTTICILTGSNPPINGYNILYIPSGSNGAATATNIVNAINNSSSYFSGIYNITASSAAPNIILKTKTTGYINNYNYIISGSTTRYFTGGTNDIITGSYQYQRLIYDSVKQLYYSNYLTSSYGDPVNLRKLIPGSDPSGDRYIGSSSNPSYDNFLQTNLSYKRYFPTETGSLIGVLSIPMTIFGEYINPHSFKMSFDGFDFHDDGEGNIISGSQIMGNIIYTHGIVTLLGNQFLSNFAASQSATVANYTSYYANAIYGTSYVYGVAPNLQTTTLGFATTNNFTCSFSSSYTIFEKQYKCTIRENEYNFTLNPSAISGSYNVGINSGVVYDFVTGSDFSPYITTVGLYDEQQNLLAIGKLAQPVPGSPTTDTTILINLDM